mmetsp:Transcript_9430/g.9496  ORF Transcript_9430/g.9496 Transcript_9430/m.9496 type:complete len:212 (-) Transcript_9430:555-1190(-)
MRQMLDISTHSSRVHDCCTTDGAGTHILILRAVSSSSLPHTLSSLTKGSSTQLPVSKASVSCPSVLCGEGSAPGTLTTAACVGSVGDRVIVPISEPVPTSVSSSHLTSRNISSDIAFTPAGRWPAQRFTRKVTRTFSIAPPFPPCLSRPRQCCRSRRRASEGAPCSQRPSKVICLHFLGHDTKHCWMGCPTGVSTVLGNITVGWAPSPLDK